MNQLELRHRSLLQFFRDHVDKRNKELLEPKLMSNARISTKYKELVRKEIEEQKDVLNFHEDIAAGNVFRTENC